MHRRRGMSAEHATSVVFASRFPAAMRRSEHARVFAWLAVAVVLGIALGLAASIA